MDNFRLYLPNTIVLVSLLIILIGCSSPHVTFRYEASKTGYIVRESGEIYLEQNSGGRIKLYGESDFPIGECASVTGMYNQDELEMEVEKINVDEC